MFANLGYDLVREVEKMRFDVSEAVVVPEWVAENLGNECVDERIALLRRHVVLDRDQTLLAVNNRLAHMAIEIGGEEQPVIDVDDDVAIGVNVRPEMGCCREAADDIPELRRIATRFVEAID